MHNNNIIKSLKRINHKLYFALLAMGFLPTIYNTVRIFLLADLPSDYGFNIASQLSWVNLIYEVIAEAIILPLFFFTGAALADKKELENRTKSGLVIAGTLNTILAVMLILFAQPLVLIMAQKTVLIETTVLFIRLESIAKIFEILLKMATVVLITLDVKRNIYIVLISQVTFTIIFDVFFLSSLPMSLNIGVLGIALSNILTSAITFLITVKLLKNSGIDIFSKTKMCFLWLRKFIKIGAASGAESLIRNLAFMLMVIRMVNVVGEQGTYWVANSFIWGWLLLPVLQLGELIKRDCAESKNAIKDKTAGYFAITTIIIALWIVTAPFWKLFLINIMGIANPDEIISIVILLTGFYVLFAYNNIIDSIFYGIGRTDLMLYQSLIVNIVYYGVAFVLYLAGVYRPSLISIALMFGIGIAIDSLITFVIFRLWLKEKKCLSNGTCLL